MTKSINFNKGTLDFKGPAIAANECPSGVINHTPIAGSRSYFRSKTFTSFIGINPLVAASNALLALNERLKISHEVVELDKLHQHLVHEVRVFESNAKERGYSSETIIIARYVLSACIDESIIYSNVENRSLWQRYKLLTTFQNEQSADERFFLILERLLSEPLAHIDLLELIYLCLSLGFRGKYRQAKGNSANKFNAIMETLYQNIRTIRNDPARIPMAMPEKQATHQDEPLQAQNLKSILIKTCAITLLGTAMIYGSFTFMYQKVSSPLKQQLHSLIQVQQTKV